MFGAPSSASKYIEGHSVNGWKGFWRVCNEPTLDANGHLFYSKTINTDDQTQLASTYLHLVRKINSSVNVKLLQDQNIIAQLIAKLAHRNQYLFVRNVVAQLESGHEHGMCWYGIKGKLQLWSVWDETGVSTID